MANISIDYEKALSQANQLERICAACKQSYTTLKFEQKRLGNYWNGLATQEFSQVLDNRLKVLKKTYLELDALADRIRTVAISIKQKDEELAAAISKKRTADMERDKPAAPVTPHPLPDFSLHDLHEKAEDVLGDIWNLLGGKK